jgi:hypothetical protein
MLVRGAGAPDVELSVCPGMGGAGGAPKGALNALLAVVVSVEFVAGAPPRVKEDELGTARVSEFVCMLIVRVAYKK